MSAAGGLLIAGAGVWVGCQVFGGKALERFGIGGAGPGGAASKTSDKAAGQTSLAVQGGPIGLGIWGADKLAQDIPGPVGTIDRAGIGAAESLAGSATKSMADLFGLGGLLR